MHDSIGRKVNTQLVECAHKSRRADGCVMWIGKHEGPLATQSVQLVDNARECSNPKMTRAGNAEYSNASMSLAQYFMSLFCAGEFLDHRFAHCKLLNLAGYG